MLPVSESSNSVCANENKSLELLCFHLHRAKEEQMSCREMSPTSHSLSPPDLIFHGPGKSSKFPLLLEQANRVTVSTSSLWKAEQDLPEVYFLPSEA